MQKNMGKADFAQRFKFAAPIRCSKYTTTLRGLAELVIKKTDLSYLLQVCDNFENRVEVKYVWQFHTPLRMV